METEHVDWQHMPINFIKNKRDILEKEVWWRENVGIHKFGLNKRIGSE
jgi:hypothetical protein